MGTNLVWEPVIHKEQESLPIGLKWALRKRYGASVNRELDSGDLSYLQGLADADLEGAQVLIDAIEKHDVIRVWER